MNFGPPSVLRAAVDFDRWFINTMEEWRQKVGEPFVFNLGIMQSITSAILDEIDQKAVNHQSEEEYHFAGTVRALIEHFGRVVPPIQTVIFAQLDDQFPKVKKMPTGMPASTNALFVNSTYVDLRPMMSILSNMYMQSKPRRDENSSLLIDYEASPTYGAKLIEGLPDLGPQSLKPYFVSTVVLSGANIVSVLSNCAPYMGPLTVLAAVSPRDTNLKYQIVMTTSPEGYAMFFNNATELIVARTPHAEFGVVAHEIAKRAIRGDYGASVETMLDSMIVDSPFTNMITAYWVGELLYASIEEDGLLGSARNEYVQSDETRTILSRYPLLSHGTLAVSLAERASKFGNHNVIRVLREVYDINSAIAAYQSRRRRERQYRQGQVGDDDDSSIAAIIMSLSDPVNNKEDKDKEKRERIPPRDRRRRVRPVVGSGTSLTDVVRRLFSSPSDDQNTEPP